MVELLPSRRRAAEFARALEGDRRSVDPALQRLLDTVSQLAAVPLVEPRPEFRDDLRTRLLEAAAVELPAQDTARAGQAGPEHPARPGVVGDEPLAARRRRRLVAAATGLVLVGGGTGVAAASEQALPGDVLYPVKRTLENAQVTLAQGADDEGRALLERASTRLQEAEALSADGSLSSVALAEVEAALADFTADASAGGARLLDSYATTGDPADVHTLREFTSTSHESLEELAETLPPQSQPELSTAGETVVALDDKAMRACPGCTPALPPLSLPTEPVSLPTLEAGASPYVEGREPLSLDDAGKTDSRRRGAGEERRGREPSGTRAAPDGDAPEPAQDTAPPALPEVDLGGGAGTSAPQGGGAPDPGQHDGGATKQRPRLDVGDLLGDGGQSSDGSPSKRKTDGPDLGDVTERLDPLLKGKEDRLRRRTGDSLDDLP